jgi:hypothetical protein
LNTILNYLGYILTYREILHPEADRQLPDGRESVMHVDRDLWQDRRDLPDVGGDDRENIGEIWRERGRTRGTLRWIDVNGLVHLLGWRWFAGCAGMIRLPAGLAATRDLRWAWRRIRRVGRGRLGRVLRRLVQPLLDRLQPLNQRHDQHPNGGRRGRPIVVADPVWCWWQWLPTRPERGRVRGRNRRLTHT